MNPKLPETWSVSQYVFFGGAQPHIRSPFLCLGISIKVVLPRGAQQRKDRSIKVSVFQGIAGSGIGGLGLKAFLEGRGT